MFLSRIIGHTVFYTEAYPTGSGPTRYHKGIGFCEQYNCSQCGRTHDAVWYYRSTQHKPFGNFMAVRIGSNWHVPDPSLPCQLESIPKSAVRLPDELASKCWHDTSGSHDFVGAQHTAVLNFVNTPERRAIINRYRRNRRWTR